MKSKNGLIKYNVNKHFVFINITLFLVIELLSLFVVVPCSYLYIKYWVEVPAFLKIIWPIIALTIFITIVYIPFLGVWVLKNGKIVAIPDFRIQVFDISRLDVFSVIFNEQENGRYSVSFRIQDLNGKKMKSDYSAQFSYMKKKKLNMKIYTISKKKMDNYCFALQKIDKCCTTIVDINLNIIYQKR